MDVQNFLGRRLCPVPLPDKEEDRKASDKASVGICPLLVIDIVHGIKTIAEAGKKFSNK